MPDVTRLVLIGGGKMGEALLAGLLAAGWADPQDLAVVERVAERRAELSAAFPGVLVTDTPVAAQGALIAVKPDDVASACAELREVGVGRVLSIAAGVQTATIEAELAAGTPVVRAMPNTPALVRAGAAAIAPGANARDDDMAWAESILSDVGIVVRVEEQALDAVTGVSGSGPAYVFFVAEALVDAAVAVGLPRDVAQLLTTQTILGAARMLHETDDDAAALRAAVTSPGGTTAAAIRVLEDEDVHGAVVRAVGAATQRARQLGER